LHYHLSQKYQEEQIKSSIKKININNKREGKGRFTNGVGEAQDRAKKKIIAMSRKTIP